MGYPELAITLEGEEVLKPLYSQYIMAGGGAMERIAIDWVKLQNREATAKCRFLEYFRSSTDDQTFHLSAQRGVDFITQVACIQVHRLNGFTDKTVEMWLNDFSLTCVRAVRDPQDIRIYLDLIGRTVTPQSGTRRNPRTFYKWRFNVGKDDWFGILTASFGFADQIGF